MNAISVVSAVLERLKYLLENREPNSLLHELNSEVRVLQLALEEAKRVLAGAEGNRTESQPLSESEKHITRLFYECEDAIEEYAQEIGPKGKMGVKSIFQSTTKNAERNLRNLEANIKGLISKQSEERHGSRQATSGENPTPVLLNKSQSEVVRRPSVRLQTKGLIDMEKNIKKVLASEGRDSPVIPVVGAGGSGKTILAKKVYEDAKATGLFQGFAWVNIPRRFEMKSMLRTILMQLRSHCSESKDEIEEMEDLELAQLLFKVVQHKKCLIVLEDVCAIHVWQSIRIAFPLSETDSKILLTTRLKDVAEESASGGTMYEMMMLSEEESWELFKKKAKLDDDGGCSEEMKTIGKEIIRHCEGSPLAVVVMGASLQTRHFDEWQRVLNALQSIEDQDSNEKVKKVLALSYSILPHSLKPCFLYLGHFPEEYYEIQVEKLYLLWMSEGLVPPKNTAKKGEMDSTESFLYQLASRSLLEMQEEEEPKFRSFKSCRLHDLIRDLCVRKGKEEEFFDITESGKGNRPSPTPRLAIHLNKYGGESNRDKASVRSLLVFDTRDSQPKSSSRQELSDLKDFKFLRVLHFDGVDFRVRELQKGFEKLAYLRYLSFQGCDLEKLPTFMSNLSSLETLDLRVRRRMIVPNLFSKMTRLRHLYFPVTYAREGTDKISLDGLISLEILENFDTEMCNSEDLSKLRKLRTLRVIAEGNANDLNVIIQCMNENSSELQLSFLDVRKFDCYSNERLSVLGLLLKCDALHVLHIEGHIGKIPEDHKISENFIQIVLNGSELEEDPMPTLGVLPKLRSLVLSNDAFVGKEMKCSASQFPQLRSLKLLNLHYLETWTVDKGSMAKLSALAIEKCGKLAMLPSGLKFAKNLKQLNIVSMLKEFTYSIQQEYGEKEKDAASGSQRMPTVVWEN